MIQSGSELYCTAAPDLAPGTILRAGAFSDRLCRQVVVTVKKDPVRLEIPEPGMTGMALLELSWEYVRSTEFPELPSRLACLFLWPSEEQARDFHSRRPYKTGLYRVVVEELQGVFVADMNHISYFKDVETVGTMIERARAYWSTPHETGEVLLDGSVRITEELQSC